MSETITGDVVGMASEGQGIVRQEGLVTFIPFAAPGDKIHYKITQQKKNFAIGKLLKVLQPSPERITSRCPYFGTCGGCQLQHINYSAQLENKRKWIEDALKKIGKFQTLSVPPVTPTDLQWCYRRRINLFLKRNQGHFIAGYIAIDNTTILEVEKCPIFADEKDPVLKTIHELCRQLKSNDPSDGKVTILKSNQKYIIHFHFKTLPDNAFDLLSETQKKHSYIQGILASSRKKSLSFGSVDASCEIDGLTFDFNPKTFIQAHPEQSVNIYREIERLGKQLEPKSILDLYCGIGISTLMLARNECKAKGIELNPESIELAKVNAIKNGLKNTSFIVADVEKVLSQFLNEDKPDLVIVNPPREGLSPKITQTLQFNSIKHLIYVSCMPATLARDLKLLCEGGYQISSVQAFDMFPQTIHVETLAVLKLA